MKTLLLVKKDTPVKLRGYPMQTDNLQNFMNEWSTSQAEANHVETIEEANDFEINDEEDADFFQNLTVYEMHDQAEENLRLVQQNQALAESNETGDQGEEPPTPHAQSAPVEPNSLEPQSSLVSANEPDTTQAQSATAPSKTITINN